MIILPAILEAVNSRKDKTLSVRFSTQELTPSQVADLIGMNQQYCFLCVKPVPFTNEDKTLAESLEVDYEITQKTPGQRLRGVFYKLYEQDAEGFKSFQTYYDGKMEKVIEHFKSKISQ